MVSMVESVLFCMCLYSIVFAMGMDRLNFHVFTHFFALFMISCLFLFSGSLASNRLENALTPWLMVCFMAGWSQNLTPCPTVPHSAHLFLFDWIGILGVLGGRLLRAWLRP